MPPPTSRSTPAPEPATLRRSRRVAAGASSESSTGGAGADDSSAAAAAAEVTLERVEQEQEQEQVVITDGCSAVGGQSAAAANGDDHSDPIATTGAELMPAATTAAAANRVAISGARARAPPNVLRFLTPSRPPPIQSGVHVVASVASAAAAAAVDESSTENGSSSSSSAASLLVGTDGKKPGAAVEAEARVSSSTSAAALGAAPSLSRGGTPPDDTGDGGEEEGDDIFPPTVFTDAVYTRGILLRREDIRDVSDNNADEDGNDGDADGDEDGDAHTTVELGYDYFADQPDDGLAKKSRDSLYGYGPSCELAARGAAASGPGRGPGPGPERSGSGSRTLPILTPEESRMWIHKHAATTAAARRFPMEAARLLGTATLHFDERRIAVGGKATLSGKCKTKTKAKASRGRGSGGDEKCSEQLDRCGLFDQCRRYAKKYNRQNRQTFRREVKQDRSRYYATVSPKQALVDAMAEAGFEENVAVASLPPTVQRQIRRRSEQMVQAWKDIKSAPTRYECWDGKYGGFVEEALGETGRGGRGVGAEQERQEERYVQLAPLARWATNGAIYPPSLDGAPMKGNAPTPTDVRDRAEGRTSSLYGGLRHIPTDAKSILESLLDLSHPRSLYKMPLVTPYAVARIVTDDAGGRTWRVRIGVYANRLLPEVLTCHHLHVVMSALDEGSYVVSQPLHLPPMRDSNDPIFESSPYPIVRIDDENEGGNTYEDADYDDDDDEDGMCMEGGEEKKEGDAAMIGSTRDESWISPFTPKGLLKLLENKGNDTSAWPDISRVLSPYMKLDLMLHQQHSVCWMLQMESLGAFGINSIIWEERKFLDGGKYYYSPALGQIRLGKPPVMNGGILADEMGLGKTIEVLGLIVATLGELKKEAEEGGPEHTHATLIIVPPALATQWRKEIEKTTGDELRVEFLDATTDEISDIVQRTSADGRVADIVLTTYGSLERPKSSRYLASIRFGRIVLDEMQEIRSSTTKIAKACERLQCQRRWMLSGTPLFDGVEDLRGELNFLHLEPYAAKLEDGFFDFSIMNHWKQHSLHGLETLRILGLLMLRRAKDMTVCKTRLPLMEQKMLTVEFVPVPQEPSERALYCWMEYIVSQELKQNEEARDMQSRNLCLRLLREICFSVVLLNGGLGVASQISTINQLMIKANRRMVSEQLSAERLAAEETNESRRKRNESIRVLSCDAALQFLTQHQSSVNVREDFVSDLAFGGGRGVTNRSHAMESVEEQVAAARRDVDSALLEQVDARRKRAKANWHLALELVTTGAMWNQHTTLGIAPKFSTLWKWRFLCSNLESRRSQRARSCPTLLLRGWRPSLTFLRRDLWANHPEFSWAHPLALRLDNIPEQVTIEDVKTGIYEAARRTPQAKKLFQTVATKLRNTESPSKELRSEMVLAEDNLRNAENHDALMKEPKVITISHSSPLHWKAFLQFSDEEDQRFVMRKASSSAGIALKSKGIVPRIQASIEEAKENFSQAVSENKVYPCRTNAKREADAKKALQQANLGLRIVFERSLSSSAQNVLLSRSVDPFRGLLPRSRTTLLESAGSSIVQSSETLLMVEGRISSGNDKIARLMPAFNRASQDVKQMSAFETLEALNENELEKTKCPICLSSFGTTTIDGAESSRRESPVVAMVNCGHFFCITCLDHYMNQQLASSRNLKCPNCRKPFSAITDVIHVDHLLKESGEKISKEREEAKRKVREASHVLDDSSGIIDGSMWHTLFLSFDLPVGINRRAHHLYTAVPRDVLAHIRAATGMPIACSRAVSHDEGHDEGRSSKIRALLRDLPLGEHSVVFTGSREAVMHVTTVLKGVSDRCYALYTGQNPSISSEAVSNWENDKCIKSKAGPVLVVQAGAAASGLTLTVASKMFLMEPFARQEEEQQAYARCHRYGQKNDVHVKIYYAPVSVESRLLEWRKKAAKDIPTSAGDGANYVFSQIYDDSDTDEDEDSNGQDGEEQQEGMDVNSREDTRRSMFLLGLVDERGNPLHVEDDADS